MLNSGDYDYYEIYHSYDLNKSKIISDKSIKGSGSILGRIVVNSAGVAMSAYRFVNYISDTELLVTDALNSSTTGKPNTNNSTLIPIRVVGYKS